MSVKCPSDGQQLQQDIGCQQISLLFIFTITITRYNVKNYKFFIDSGATT